MFRRGVLLRSAAECTLTVNDYVAQIVMQRPAKKNALGKQMLEELRTNFQQCHLNNDVRVVVLSSTVEGVFCAGADLKERKEMTPKEAREFVNKLRSTFCEIEDLSVPVIAAVEGAALGGGLELALAADLRIAGMKAKLGVPETGLAIIPGAGGTQRLSHLIGAGKAKELTFTALPVDPTTAERIGLVNHAVEPGCAVAKATEMALRIAQNGPIAVAAAKVAISNGAALSRTDGMLLEQLCYDKVLATQDRLEGLKAFAEKRKPQYKGC